MKKKKIDAHQLKLQKTRISNFNITGGSAESSVSRFVACPEPGPTGVACKPSKWCTSWRLTQCDRGTCA